jgi:hypothetical protein
MSAYTNHGKTTSVKKNSGRKLTLTLRSTVSKKSHNYCSTGDRMAELNIRLDDLVSTKTVRCELLKSNIHVMAAIAKLLITQVMLRCVNDGVMTIKSGHQTTGNTLMIWSNESSFMLFPASRRVYIWTTPKEAYNPESLVPTMKHMGDSVMVWAVISWYSILLVPLLPFMAKILQEGKYVDRLGNQAHPMNQTF